MTRLTLGTLLLSLVAVAPFAQTQILELFTSKFKYLNLTNKLSVLCCGKSAGVKALQSSTNFSRAQRYSSLYKGRNSEAKPFRWGQTQAKHKYLPVLTSSLPHFPVSNRQSVDRVGGLGVAELPLRSEIELEWVGAARGAKMMIANLN